MSIWGQVLREHLGSSLVFCMAARWPRSPRSLACIMPPSAGSSRRGGKTGTQDTRPDPYGGFADPYGGFDPYGGLKNEGGPSSMSV